MCDCQCKCASKPVVLTGTINIPTEEVIQAVRRQQRLANLGKA